MNYVIGFSLMALIIVLSSIRCPFVDSYYDVDADRDIEPSILRVICWTFIGVKVWAILGFVTFKFCGWVGNLILGAV